MMLRGRDVALSLLTVGTAAAVGYFLQSGRGRDSRGELKADVGARVVEDVPDDAAVVDVSSRQLQKLPVVREAIDRALRTDATEEWAHVTLEREDAWELVDALRQSLPYHEGDGSSYNGIYVRCRDRIVVIDAIGWARVERALQ